MLLKRDRSAYETEHSEWQEWNRQNPEQNDWRVRNATESQIMLIERIAEDRGVEMPQSPKRGEAHDWIEQHGGNLRLAPDAPKAAPEGDACATAFQ